MRACSAENRRAWGELKAPFSYEALAFGPPHATPRFQRGQELRTHPRVMRAATMRHAMKKLPKRNGYKPGPSPRRPADREIIQAAVARLLVGVAKDHGIEVPPQIAKLAERKGRAKVTLWF